MYNFNRHSAQNASVMDAYVKKVGTFLTQALTRILHDEYREIIMIKSYNFLGFVPKMLL